MHRKYACHFKTKDFCSLRDFPQDHTTPTQIGSSGIIVPANVPTTTATIALSAYYEVIFCRRCRHSHSLRTIPQNLRAASHLHAPNRSSKSVMLSFFPFGKPSVKNAAVQAIGSTYFVVGMMGTVVAGLLAIVAVSIGACGTPQMYSSSSTSTYF